MNTGDKAQSGRVGRIQRQVRRFSWIRQEWPVTTRDLLAWAFPRIQAGEHREWHFKSVRRAAERWLMRESRLVSTASGTLSRSGGLRSGG
jgi:hypothetical protein